MKKFPLFTLLSCFTFLACAAKKDAEPENLGQKPFKALQIDTGNFYKDGKWSEVEDSIFLFVIERNLNAVGVRKLEHEKFKIFYDTSQWKVLEKQFDGNVFLFLLKGVPHAFVSINISPGQLEPEEIADFYYQGYKSRFDEVKLQKQGKIKVNEREYSSFFFVTKTKGTHYVTHKLSLHFTTHTLLAEISCLGIDHPRLLNEFFELLSGLEVY